MESRTVDTTDTQKAPARDRRNPLRSLLLLLALLGVWLAACWQGQTELAEEIAHERATATAVKATPAPVVPAVVGSTYVVRRGDTFGGILYRLGVCDPGVTSYYNNLVDLGMAAIFPGDTMEVLLGADSSLSRLSLLNRRQCWYRVERRGDTVRCGRYPLQRAVYRCRVEGTLNTSLSEDMYLLGEGDGLVAKLTEILAWDIDFFTDPRKGDRFEVYFEKHYAGGRSAGYGDVLAARYHTASRTYSAFGLRDSTGRMQYYDAEGNSVQKKFLKAPLRYSRVSSGFSYSRRHPILGIYRPHLGVDYAAPVGTPVHAAADGIVTHAGWKGDYGNTVKISHGAAYKTLYGHLHKIARGISPGVRVAQGQMIGVVGKTGLATGPHLDYRMYVSGRAVNPMTVILPAGEAVPEERRDEFEHARFVHSLMLDQRLPDAHGSYVLDIQLLPVRTEERVAAVYERSADGASAGS